MSSTFALYPVLSPHPMMTIAAGEFRWHMLLGELIAGRKLAMANFYTRIDEPSGSGKESGESQPHVAFPKAVWGLEIVRGTAQQMFRPIAGPVFMIGTAADSDLVLADESFPETYLYLYVKTDEQLNETVSVRRFGVGPELLVDEVELDVAELPVGSLLEFGAYAFRLTQRTSSQPGGDGPGRGPDSNDDDEPFLPADFSAWEIDESAALDKVRALLADVRASLQTAKQHQGLKLFMGARTTPSASTSLRRQSA
ncbi:FHA domain-containing protein [Anatilimnocola floriformis]|uniref:FHA domain-containing protein n=1 Tax=Anatilimnocola floriformis TaxID=2948575 RepID=UPI0020C42740|nr:FHA domain-containing protein [Anatilimnocola floriformis]